MDAWIGYLFAGDVVHNVSQSYIDLARIYILHNRLRIEDYLSM